MLLPSPSPPQLSQPRDIHTHISGRSGFVQHIGVTCRVFPDQDHAEVGSFVTGRNPLLHFVAGFLSNLARQLSPRNDDRFVPAKKEPLKLLVPNAKSK